MHARVAAALVAGPVLLSGGLARAGELNDRFGYTIAADAQRVAIAAPESNDAGFNAGAVELHVLREGTWRFEQRVESSEARPFGRFGAWVALDGDVLAVGTDPYRGGQGSVFVFVRGAEGWDEVDHLTLGSDATEHDFGRVGVDGEWVAAAASHVLRGERVDPGELHLYRRSGDRFIKRQVLRGEPGPRRTFARSFRLAEGLLIVGVGADLEAYVEDAGTWRREPALDPPLEVSSGWYVFSGTTLVVLDVWDDLAFAYTRTDGGWSVGQKIPIALGETYPFGFAVGSDWAALSRQSEALDRFWVDLFVRDGEGWRKTQELERAVPGEGFGFELAFAGDWLWVGEPGIYESVPGEALVYRRSGEEWRFDAVASAGGMAGSGCAIGCGTPGLLVLGALRRRRRARR